jgi:prephenate dehydratase
LNIEDNSTNTTRFLVLSKRALEDEDEKFPYITSIMFTLNNDDPGTLCGALDSFRKHGVNLTAITLRPSHIKQWQYVFFVEIIGAERDENVQQSLASLRQGCNVVIVGSFRRCGRYYKAI